MSNLSGYRTAGLHRDRSLSHPIVTSCNLIGSNTWWRVPIVTPINSSAAQPRLPDPLRLLSIGKAFPAFNASFYYRGFITAVGQSILP